MCPCRERNYSVGRAIFHCDDRIEMSSMNVQECISIEVDGLTLKKKSSLFYKNGYILAISAIDDGFVRLGCLEMVFVH